LAFKHQCERLELGRWYTAWLLETSQSHPSAALAESFLRSGTEHGIALLSEPWTREIPAASLGAPMMLVASRCFDSLVRGNPWSARLTRLEQRLSKTIR
jgi:hypothetical protein